MADVGRASVEVVGDVRNFARQVERDLNAALKKIKVDPIEVSTDRDQAMRAGEEAGNSFGAGARRGAEDHFRDSRSGFAREGEKLGHALADGSERGFDRRSRGFGRRAISNIGDTLGKGISSIGSMIGPALATGATVAATAFSVSFIAIAAGIIIPTLAAALTSGLGIALGAGLIGLGALLLKDVKPLQNAFKDFSKTLKEFGQQVAKPLLKPFIGSLKILENSLKALKPVLGGIFKSLAPSIKPFTTALSGFLLEALKGIQDAMPGIVAAFNAFASVLPTVGKWLGDFFRTIFENSDVIDNATVAITKLIFGPLKLLGPIISGLTVVFGALSNAFLLGAQAIEPIKQALLSFVDGGSGAIERLRVAWGPLGDAIQNVWDKLKEFAGEDDTSKLAEKFVAFVQSIKDAWGPLKDFLGVVWDEALAFIQRLWEEKFVPWWIGTAQPWLAEAIPAAFGFAWDLAVEMTMARLVTIRDRIMQGINQIPGLIARGLAVLPTMIVNAIAAIPGIVGRIFSSASSTAQNIALRMVAATISIVRTLPGRISAALAGIQRAVIGAFAGASGWLIGAGRQIIGGLIQGIQSGFDRVRGLLNELTGMLPDWKGPAAVDKKILQESGRMVMQGFEAGLISEFRSVQRTLGALTGGMPGMTGGAFGVSAAPASTSTLTIMPGAIVINGTGSSAGQTAEAVLERLAQANLVRRR